MLIRDAFLQTATQFNLHTIAAMGPIIHEQKVSVVVIKAGQSALATTVHGIMSWETTLQRRQRRMGK